MSVNILAALVLAGLVVAAAAGWIRMPGAPSWTIRNGTVPAEAPEPESVSVFKEWLRKKHGGAYPDFFSGACIRNGILCVLVTCEPASVSDGIRAVVGDASFTMLQAKYSYNELERQRSAMERVLEERRRLSGADRAIAGRVTGLGIDDRWNEVYIEVAECTGEEVELLMRLVDPSVLISKIRVDKQARNLSTDPYGNALEETDPARMALPGLSVRTESPRYPVGTRDIRLILRNDSDTGHTFGRYYSFERFDADAGIWRACPFFMDSLYGMSDTGIAAHATSTRTVTLSGLQTPPEPGRYRVLILDNRYACEFEIVE